jgi:Zn-dependent protease
MMNLLSASPQVFFHFIIAILLALTIHEASHALVAKWLGDNTAEKLGRISLNPAKHLTLWGSLLFLFVGIGWGKPVPVNPTYFKNPKRDHALVALAGPLSNFILAILFAIPIMLYPNTIWSALAMIHFNLNVLLCAFNLIPIPPLDGSKIAAIFLPKNVYYKYNQFIEGNLAYIIIFFLFDIYVLESIIGFSFTFEIVNFITGLIKTVIFLGT